MKTFFCLVLLGVFATCLAQHKRNEKERRESPYSAYQPGRLPTYLSYLSQSKSEDVPLPVLKNYRPQGTSYRPQSTSTTQAQSQGVDVNGYLQYLGDTVNYIKQVLAGILY